MCSFGKGKLLVAVMTQRETYQRISTTTWWVYWLSNLN